MNSKLIILLLSFFFIVLSCFSTRAQGYYSMHGNPYTIRKAYEDNQKKELTYLELRVDRSFSAQFFDCNNCSISDFKKLKTLVVVVDYFQGGGYSSQFTTKKQHIEIFNKWMNNLDSMEHTIKVVIPSNFKIMPQSFMEELEIYTFRQASYDFKEFKNLKKITLTSKDTSKFEFINVMECEKLETISLRLRRAITVDLSVFPASLQKIKIFGENIKNIDFRPLPKFTNLKSLELKTDNLEIFDPKKLEKNVKLEEFSIVNKKIKTFNFDDLLANPLLRIVKLDLDSLQKLTFPKTNLKYVEIFELKSLVLKKLPENFDKFTSVTSVELELPMMESISEDFFNAKTIAWLQISISSLQSIPTSLFNLTELNFLEIALLKLKFRGREFKKLSKLREVHIIKPQEQPFSYSRNCTSALLKKLKVQLMLLNLDYLFVGRCKS